MLLKWGLTNNQQYDCGASIQTIQHIAIEYPLKKFKGSWNTILEATPKLLHG